MSETIVFFGSGPVAAKSLELLAQDFTIEAVITKPRPDYHKEAFPVLEVADRLGLKVLAVSNKIKLVELFAKGRPLKSHIGVVIDYGIIIPQAVIDYFRLGIVNSHFSLLPEWRGADPISFSLLSGQKKTGISLMLITAGLDEGPLLSQSDLTLAKDITGPELTDQLIELSHTTLKSTLPDYVAGKVRPTEQKGTPSFSSKLSKQDSLLDFSKPAEQLEREVRAFIEWPRSRTKLGDVDVVVTKAHVTDKNGPAGEPWVDEKQLSIYTSQGSLVIDRLIPAGKKEMPAEAFLAGYKLS